MAANNILNVIFMVGGTSAAAGLAFAGLGPAAVLGVVAIVNMGVAALLIASAKSMLAPTSQAAMI